MWMLKKRRFLTIVFFLTTSCNNESSKSKLTSQLTSFKTNDIGNTLEEVLERDRTQPSCDAYWNLLDDEDMQLKNSGPNQLDELEVLCGKWLFIGWETTGKLPLPEILFDAVKRSWPDRVGKNFEKLGFLPNPTDPAGRPLGIARSTTKYTGMPSVNVTCAACHVGQLPDGRYAIGAPNTKLDLSTFNLMSYYPLYMAMSNDSRSELPKAVQEFFRELEKTERKRVLGGKYLIDWSNLVFKYSKMLRMLNIGPKGLPDAQFVVMTPTRDLNSWMDGRPGVFNPGAPMLTLQKENVPNLSIPQIWDISGHEADYQSGLVAPLGQTTKYASLEKFVSSALVYAYQDLSLVRPRHVRPLVAYLRQLKAPVNLTQAEPNEWKEGEVLFTQACQECHNGAAGETTRLYSSDFTGTAPALENPRENYKATTPIAQLIEGLSRQLDAELTPQPQGIRSRRLSGIWARKDLMIDGSVADLNDLFCMETPSRAVALSPHQDLCTDFSTAQKKALMSYLSSF